MNLRSSLPAIILAIAVSNAPLCGTELRVSTMIDDRPLDLAGVTKRGTLTAGPDRVEVNERGIWKCDGDLHANATQVRWAPVYTIRRADERSARLTPDKPWRARVEIRHAPKAKPATKKDLAPLLADWPDGLPSGGVAIAVWLLDGNICETSVLPLPSTGEDSFGFAAEFNLSEDQALRGQAALLLWRDGALVAPAPQFPDSAAQQAMFAVMRDDAVALDRLISQGVPPDVKSRDGYSLIHYAAEAGSTRCIETLVKRKPGVANLSDVHDWKAIHHAARQGRVSAIRTLVAAKAKLDASIPGYANLPLSLATEAGHTGTVEALLASKVRASGGGARMNPIELAIWAGYSDIADRLLAAKAKFDFKAPTTDRVLLMAALHGHNSMVRWLLRHGADANANIRGTSVLGIAARSGDLDTARALVEAGAKVNSATEQGYTPLMAAALAANTGYARILLESGADATGQTATAVTALHLAAQANASELADMLLSAGADPKAVTQSGRTPLELALAAGAPDTARTLAAQGAVINLGSAASESLLAAAVRLDIAEVIEAALREGWPANSNFAGVWPAIRVAEIFKSEKCRQLLLAAGAGQPDAGVPMPLVSSNEIDAPVRLVRPPTLIDPRDSDEVFPETTVRVSVLLDAEGRPLFPALTHSPDPRLGPAALECATGLRFTPVRRQGQPAAVRIQIPISFPASADRVYELERLQNPPIPVKQDPPVYPFALKEKGITGRVELAFVVTTSGKVEDLEVLYASHPALGAAAAAAIKEWVFNPGLIDGVPVNTRMRQPISFTLSQ